ncbi:E3 ubiquitin-protein ligase arih2, partial [Pichia californica]
MSRDNTKLSNKLPSIADSLANSSITPSPTNDLETPSYSSTNSNSNPTNITSILNPSKSSADLSNLTAKINTTTFSTIESKQSPQNSQNNEDDDSSKDTGNNNSNDNDSINELNDLNENSLNNASNAEQKNMPPRKRSKVSRACDECRRKKIRCNAVFDMNLNSIVTICTSCERNDYSCTFTRIPLKRGPNKGYTKKSLSSSTSLNADLKKNISSPKTPQSPSFNNSTGIISPNQNDSPYSEKNSRSNSTNKSSLHFLPNQQQQVILPPLNSIPFNDNIDNITQINANNQNINEHNNNNNNSNNNSNTTTNDNNNQIFWKVPTDMPSIPPSINLRGRNGSIDSTHSSIKNSDSEEEFLANNPSRLSTSAFQVPFSLNSRSTRLSFTSDKDPRSSVSSSIVSSESVIQSVPGTNITSSQQQQQQQQQSSQKFSPLNQTNQMSNISQFKQLNNSNLTIPEYKEAVPLLLDHYYSTLYLQYPLLPNLEIIKISINSIIDNSDFYSIIELFYVALQSIGVITDLTIQKQTISNINNNQTTSSNNEKLQNQSSDSIISIKFSDITRCFEIFTSMYLSKSLIYQSVPGKIILTSTLLLLNYAIVISGYKYSLGFGIAFSYFKDWLIFKEGYESPCFANLIQLVSLDSLHTLYYGLPRSSTVCFAIDPTFISTFVKEVKFPQGIDLEWLCIGLHLVVLNNNLQELDTLNKLDSIEVTGTEYKFMSIIKLYYDLFIYCRNLNLKLQQIILNYNSNIDKSSLNEVLKTFIYNVELDISKISKKLTNLIDEQIDDIELTKPNPLIALVLIKCTHISINIQIFVKSIIHLNEVLDSNNSMNKSNFNTLTNNDINIANRTRSDSDASIDSFNGVNTFSDFSSAISDCNKRFSKLKENMGSNILRCQNITHTHQHSHELINLLINTEKADIIVPRTSLNSNKGGIDYTVVIQHWI